MVRAPLDQDTVVDAAMNLADREGIDSVTLTRVAKELGVRQPALYRHVDGYDDLMRSLGLRGREILAERLGEAAIGVAEEEAVTAVGLAWRQFAADHPGIYSATDRYPCVDDEELEAAVDRVVDIIGQSLAAFDLSEVNKVHAARTLRSAFHGFTHLEAGDGHPHPTENDETFDHMIALICTGIRKLQ